MAASVCDAEYVSVEVNDMPLASNPYTMSGKLREVWTLWPDREGIVYYDDNNVRSSITNKELMLQCERFASVVRSEGIKRGDVVCNMVRPGIEKEVANFGLMLAGVVVMDGSCIDDSSHTFWRPLQQANAKAIIMEPHPDAIGYRKLKSEVGGDAFVERYSGRHCTSLMKLFVFKVTSREYRFGPATPTVKPVLEILENNEGKWADSLFAHYPCCIFMERCPFQKHYKLVIRTHGEMCLLAERSLEMLNFGDHDVVFNDLPLTWMASIPFAYIMKGCTLVKSALVDYEMKTVVRETWDILENEKCTLASLHPHMVQMLSSHCADLPEPHHRLNTVTTSYNVKNTLFDAIGPLTTSIIVCYAHIEAGLVSRLVVTERNLRQYRKGCAGHQADTVRTQFDFMSMHSPDPYKTGEIILSGRLIVKGYYNDDYLTKCGFTPRGEFITGDLGYYRDGNLYVLGPKGNAIIRRNLAIFPVEIEENINECPGIWKAKVVLVRDPTGTPQMCACVVPRSQESSTIETVRKYCRLHLTRLEDHDVDTFLPAYVFFFEEFPIQDGRVNMYFLSLMASEIISRRSQRIEAVFDEQQLSEDRNSRKYSRVGSIIKRDSRVGSIIKRDSRVGSILKTED